VTGVFAGICGINILQNPGLLVMTFVASTIADIDVPSSIWGRVLKPLSRRINRRYGHRTLTHSLLFMLLLWGVVWLVTRMAGSELPYPTIFVLAFSSHLIFDMMTVQGVLLLYPYSKRPCVIPADPTLRLKTNNPGSELALFGFFVLSGLFMQPLMADGFWTSYNRLFGTMQHLQSEFEKSEDLLQVDYHYREGSQEFRGTGFAIEATGTTATLWSERWGWQYLDGSPTSSRTILEVIPEHTGKEYELVRQSFVAISADSLHHFLDGKTIYQLDLSANEAFEIVSETKEGRKLARQTKCELSLVESIHVQEIVTGSAQREIVYRTSPRIATLTAQQRRLESKLVKVEARRRAHHQEVASLEDRLDGTEDIYQRTQLLGQLQELRKWKDEPSPLIDKLREIEVQLRELQRQDQLDHQERLAEAAEKAAADNSPLRLSGVATLVKFGSPVR